MLKNFTLENDKTSNSLKFGGERLSASYAKLKENKAKENKNSVIPLIFTPDFYLTLFVFAGSKIQRTSWW